MRSTTNLLSYTPCCHRKNRTCRRFTPPYFITAAPPLRRTEWKKLSGNFKDLRLDRPRSGSFVFRGCRAPLEGPELPQESEAVNDLIRKARQASPDDPLYVIGIGACTNIVSAILKCPEIIENLVVVWLGGNTRDWVYPSEFNLSQDLAAGQVLFDCGVPLVQIPAFGVTNFLITTVPELEACLAGKNKICDYLVDNVKAYSNDHFAWSKAIWM